MADEPYHFFPGDVDQILPQMDKSLLKDVLGQMLLIRHFEQRGEAAYQQGKVG